MHKIPIDTDNPSNLILDLMYNLRIKEVMTKKVLTASRTDSLRDIQKLMKENMITGVPILENRRPVGIISTDDIIQALDGGYINASADEYMTSDLIILEDDMPLSYGISFFRKFKFSRFPVINKNRELVGIITAGDVISALLVETNRLVQTLESKINVASPIPYKKSRHLTYSVRRHDFENAGKASSDIKKILRSRNIDTKITRRVAIAAYEMEMNMNVHSIGGTLEIMIDEEKICLSARDKGPGIEDTAKAMQEGFSTANDWIRSLGFGAGMGLPNIKRVSDEFSINSVIADGTAVQAIIYFRRKEDNNESAADS